MDTERQHTCLVVAWDAQLTNLERIGHVFREVWELSIRRFSRLLGAPPLNRWTFPIELPAIHEEGAIILHPRDCVSVRVSCQGRV